MRASHASEMRSFLGSPTAGDWESKGALVASSELGPLEIEALKHDPGFATAYEQEVWGGVWRHDRVFFPSSAEEWSPGMLQRAGALTLNLAIELLGEGRGLKDATPGNILFRGSKPVFIDMLSIERRDPTDPLWLPYAQFVRTFLLPLLVTRETRLPLKAIFNVGREGIEPEVARDLIPVTRRLAGPGLWQVTIATMLSRSAGGRARSTAPARRSVNRDQAAYVLKRLLRGLYTSLDKAGSTHLSMSSWTEYVEDHHSRAYFDAKRAFVASAVDEMQPRTVLDIGCNTGELSVIAAQHGAEVVAIDNDPQVVERVFQRASADKLNILPLVVDIASPTPARGWMNRELPSFLDRATGAFDQVLAMAVIHHLLATNGIPLLDVVDLLARLTRRSVALEFVPPTDPLFRQIARGRDYLYEKLTQATFEAALGSRFEIVRAQPLPSGDRVGYVLRKRDV